ncbi:hypothetical protein NDU88_001731 [Pleurodeles waltl]|uniref:Uncharacterized protein n=1 Tax=Pleurodeles waltl TaxID=8319 RepID=A0AAV7P9M0_PLEWA|nr:hypothetical protein NDU88_001731 [Pleurodeles waltl]
MERREPARQRSDAQSSGLDEAGGRGPVTEWRLPATHMFFLFGYCSLSFFDARRLWRGPGNAWGTRWEKTRGKVRGVGDGTERLDENIWVTAV